MDKFKKKIIFEEEMGPVQGESEQDKYEREWFGDASRALTQLVNSEKNAIIEYENVLKYQDYLDEEQVAQIQEILQDEKDHIVLLSKMISQVIPEDYPGSGDEVEMTESLHDTGISLSKEEDMEENETNKYCQKYDLGQRVRFKHPGGVLSREVGMIIGIDSEGYYIVRWPDGENSNGISDVQLVPYIRRELGR